MKKIVALLIIVMLSAFVTGCDTGSSPASFTPTTIDFDQEGDELRFYTDDAANAEAFHSIWYSTYSSSGSVTFTCVMRKVLGSQGNSYGMRIYNADNTDEYFTFLISDYGSYYLAFNDANGTTYFTFDGVDDYWENVTGMTTGINVSHTLSISYTDDATGTIIFSVDGTQVETYDWGSGFSGRPGLRCYTDSPSETNPFDYRFKMTSPFVSP